MLRKKQIFNYSQHEAAAILELFADKLSGKFATNSHLNIPPHLKYVATLPCKIWMSENWQQSEIWIVINDIWQGSIASI